MKRMGKILFLTIIIFCISLNKVWAGGPNLTRLNGTNRILTSIEISRANFEKSKTAILVGYDGEIDALTGTILAEKKKAPILISHKNNLDDNIIRELERLDSEEVFILGGEGALRPEIEEALKDRNYRVKRIKGRSREETAINISKEAIDGDSDRAFLALGYGVYADALAIGPIAANKNIPLLLTENNKIGKDTLDFLKDSKIKNISIIGGKNAISSGIESKLKDLGIGVDRVEGKGREDTAVNIAKKYVESPDGIILANGYEYADAVVGGYFSSKENSPILLNNDRALKDINSEYIRGNGLDITVLGGEKVINNSVLRDIKLGLGIISKSYPTNLAELQIDLKEGLESFQETITIDYKGTMTTEEVSRAIRDVYSDGSYMAGAVRRISPAMTQANGFTKLNFFVEYYNTLEEEEFIQSQVDRILKEIIKPGMSEFQKVRAAHDYIVNNTSYSNATKKTAHSAYSVFKEKKGVCQGYTLATYRLLDSLGIENYYVLGRSLENQKKNSHCWNLVKIDGRYYNLDTTKNDPLVKPGDDRLSYRYFLISDKTLNKTHEIDKAMNLPRATSSKYEGLNGAENPYEYKNRLYFGNKDDRDKLYSISLNDFKLRKLSDIRAPYVTGYKDTLYFSNYSNGGYIYSSRMDGSALRQLNSVHSTSLDFESPYIKYYNNKNNRWEKLDIRK